MGTIKPICILVGKKGDSRHKSENEDIKKQSYDGKNKQNAGMDWAI